MYISYRTLRGHTSTVLSTARSTDRLLKCEQAVSAVSEALAAVKDTVADGVIAGVGKDIEGVKERVEGMESKVEEYGSLEERVAELEKCSTEAGGGLESKLLAAERREWPDGGIALCGELAGKLKAHYESFIGEEN